MPRAFFSARCHDASRRKGRIAPTCRYLRDQSCLPKIKSLWLDPRVFKNHGHEIKELPLSPLRSGRQEARREEGPC